MQNPGRRGFLLGGTVIGATALVSACTGNTAETPSQPPAEIKNNAANDQPGTNVVIGFSAPAADHGWIAAIAKNAAAAAGAYSDVTFKPAEPTNHINQHISAVESLIQQKVAALVTLRNDGPQPKQYALKAI